MNKVAATAGTKGMIWANAGLGALAAAEQSGLLNLIPPQYAMWATLALSVFNAFGHAMTGNAPVVGASTPPVA